MSIQQFSQRRVCCCMHMKPHDVLFRGDVSLTPPANELLSLRFGHRVYLFLLSRLRFGQIIEDKTFGLKNKNKSKAVQVKNSTSGDFFWRCCICNGFCGAVRRTGRTTGL